MNTEGGVCSDRSDETDSVERSDDPQDPSLDGRSVMAKREGGRGRRFVASRAVWAVQDRRH
ncbi:MAG TPA: hypothetical protein VKB78_12445, partial [Pirellulales bacterium]|nr:hypothetical protein [Pirellulales bacterium]